MNDLYVSVYSRLTLKSHCYVAQLLRQFPKHCERFQNWQLMFFVYIIVRIKTLAFCSAH